MSAETAAVIQAISSIFAGGAAVVAIFIALMVERRTNNRFAEQLKREEELALANLKPVISIFPSKFLDHKVISIVNLGMGTAMIQKINFSKDTQSDNLDLRKFFPLPKNVNLDYYWVFRESKYYIPPGEKIKLIEISEKGILEDGVKKNKIKNILNSFQSNMEGLKIRVDYSDILGKQDDYFEITLTSKD